VSHAPLSVAALVPYATGTTPSQRFRIEQWAPVLEGNGIAVRYFPFAGPALTAMLQAPGRNGLKAARLLLATGRRFMTGARLGTFDVILIHRAACLAGPPWLERSLRLLGTPIVFDFDDAIWRLHTSAANRRLGWLKFPGKTAAICRISDHVVAGNAYLAEYARRFNPDVTVAPSSIDVDAYQPMPRSGAGDKVVVGWMGSSTSQTYLELAVPMLRGVAALPRVEIQVISNRRPELPGVPFVWRPWSPETEVTDLAGFDIGIMPMPDDEWALGKCALKALSYMAMGVSTVASPVGANREVIEQGRNGLFASSDAEWVQAVGRLAGDRDLRERLGRAGRETVVARYSMRSSAAVFEQVVREVAARRAVGPRR
jgi:glycosyltransferase involved in cell wall biosynthesis